MDKIGYDTKYVNRYTRAGVDGKKIICPLCDKTSTVYHFAWSALSCDGCGAMVEKAAWMLSPKNRAYSFTLDNEYRRPADRPYGTIGDAPLSDILFDVLVEFKSRGTLGNALKTIERRVK